MRGTPINDGWTVGPKRGLFDGFSGEAAVTEQVTLPHDAMLALSRSADAPSGSHGGYFPGGAVEYTRDLPASLLAVDGVNTLVFEGVYRDAMVYVNDHFAGQNPGGYSRFAVRLDPFVTDGEAVRLRVEARAHRDSRWYSGLGIHRPVSLVTGPLVHIALDGITVTTPEVESGTAVVAVSTAVANDGLRTRTVTATTIIVDPAGTEVARGRRPITLLAGETGVVHERLLVDDAMLWDTDTPHLYRATVSIDGDQDSTAFGIRTLQLDARRGLRINGRSVKLRGACIHHDNGIIGARSNARADERRIELLKEAGFNAIRSAHNPLATEMIEACDRLGMLVMDESFDMWAEAKSPFDYSLAFPEWWERDLRSMVVKDRNHPSVIMYSIGNEIPETGATHGSRIGRLLAERLRELDPTRLTTNSINGLVSVIRELPPLEGGSQDVNDAMADPGDLMSRLIASDLVTERTEESLAAVDVAGLNYGDTRYVSDASLFPNRVIVGSETFPTHIDRNWRLVLENPHVIGDFTWTGWDYLGEAGIGRVDRVAEGGFGGTSGPYPWQLAWCGDIDIIGNRRPASYYREIVFGLRTAPYLAVQHPLDDGLRAAGGPWSWSDTTDSWTWEVADGSPLTVEVYSEADEVEVLLDGARIGSVATGEANRFRGSLTVPYAPGTLTAIARTGGVETGRHSLTSATGSAALHVAVDRETIRAAGDDLAFVSIELRGENGVVDPRGDRAVTVTVEGPGALLGLGSARPDTTESYLGATHTTFEGRLLAAIRPTGTGEVTVTATVDGQVATARFTVA